MKRALFLFFAFLQVSCFATYYSQCGQDKFVFENYFEGYNSGTFVDIGAHSGIEISNTYFFEDEMNWSGICIEPIPELFQQLQMNRRCICIQGCITNKTGQSQFIRFPSPNEWFSGLKDKYNPDQLKTLAMYGLTTYELIDVNCYLLNDLLASQNVTHVNFLSIDTEGGEFEIITSIDFSKYSFDVIAVEDNFNDPRFVPYLSKKGYNFVKKLDQDLIFVRKGFVHSQK